MQSKAHGRGADEPARGDPWRRAGFSGDELAAALVASRIAGPVTTHDRANVRWKIRRLVSGDPDAQFGLTGLAGPTEAEVLALMAEETGFDPDPDLRQGPSSIDPWRVLGAMEAVGRRLAKAAGRGQSVLLATGHPAGLLLLYQAAGRLLEEGGARLVRPAAASQWEEAGRVHQIRYFHGVAVLTDRGSALHTHSPAAMERMLGEATPDLVFADHGFAGAAIEAGVETISIADVNDPAPVVARAQGRTGLVVVMDDNVQPEEYWPCFQAMAMGYWA
jgi:hypothetical protein